MASLDELADIVLIAAPPLGTVAAGTVLAARADRTVIVARSGHSRRSQIRDIIASLDEVEAQVAGIVLATRRRGPRQFTLRRGRASNVPTRHRVRTGKRQPVSKMAES